MKMNDRGYSRGGRQMFDQDAASPKGAFAGQAWRAPQRRDAGPQILAEHRRGAVRGGIATVHQSRKTAERKRRRRRRRRVAFVAVGLVFMLLAGLVIWGYNALSNQIRGEDTEAGSVPEQVTTKALPEYTGKGLICGLICGIDYDNEGADGYVDPNNKVGNTDLILYLMYDTVNNKANILYIPRDMYVGEEAETGGVGRVNALYRNSMDKDNRMRALMEVLHQQLGLPTDFYVTIDMDALKAIVEHKGYIKTFVPQEITDGNTGDRLISQGWQNITSQEVEYLVRNRNYAASDRTRQLTQMYFLSALFRELKQLTPTDLVIWMRIMLYYCNVGNISAVQLGGLAQKALQLENTDITFVQLPVSGATYVPSKGPLQGRAQDLICLVPDETADVLNRYFRPSGHTVLESGLKIQVLPVNQYGQGPAEIRTMADIQATEPEDE